MDERDPAFLTNKQEFAEFLDPENADSVYSEKARRVVQDGDGRLVVNLNDVNAYNPLMRRNVLQNPLAYIPAWEEALNDLVTHNSLGTDALDKTASAMPQKPLKIGLQGGFGSARMTPQELRAAHVGSMVCLEGIVTKVSLVRPKVVQTVHYCEATKKYSSQTYRDATALTGLPTGSAYPTADADGNPLSTEFGLSTYVNSQRVLIQDMPERAGAGCMPQTIECLLEDDLVDACKPGDRVQMYGIYRALAGRVNGTMSGRMKTVVLANNVRKLGVDDNARTLSMDEVREIQKLGKRDDIFDLLGRSIVPSLYGHENIKKAVLLQLIGGLEKNLENGTHIRGDINILMVGDPSCGKSQMLRAVMNIAPLALNTTGRGSSGVGLTAAVTMDKDTGERRLEAGAMVLADRGVVCIDEFDKMSDMDRTAIHEVMEQQTVTISKAGIHTSLNARCSVIAAANPVYGQYDRRLSPQQNIALPDSLLSRFDLLFIVLDKIDAGVDKKISEHVLNMHLTPHSEVLCDQFADDDLEQQLAAEKDVAVWERRSRHQRGGRRSKGKKKNAADDDMLTLAFCKKYIEFTKKQFKPRLTDDACTLIAAEYAKLRKNENTQTLPITARCLETVIRLSTAVAKLRQSQEIGKDHVYEALDVLFYALTNDAEAQTSKSRLRDVVQPVADGNADDSDEDKDDAEYDPNEERLQRRVKRRRKQQRVAADGDAEMERVAADGDAEMKRTTTGSIAAKRQLSEAKATDTVTDDLETEESSAASASKTKRRKVEAAVVVTAENVREVCRTLAALFRRLRTDNVSVQQLAAELTTNGSAIAAPQLDAILTHLHDTNKVFRNGTELHCL